jgi:hypothetical protein
MIMIITLTLSFLVALNFFLLIFSCNKTSKREITDKSQVIENIITRKKPVTSQLPSNQLAPTGS